MAKPEVSVLIRAKDLASSVVGRFRRSLRSVVRTARDVATGIAATTAAIAGMVVGMQKLGERGSKVIGVQQTFAKITGDMAGALNRLNAAAGGTISKMDLMTFHNQAVALGAAKSTEEFANLVEMSKALGRAQGIDAATALEKFTVALARQSKLRLDDLGIIIDVEGANESYARSIGKTADQLTDLERAEAFRSTALRQGAELVERLTGETLKGAEAADRMGAMWKNLGDRISTVVAESPLVGAFMDQVADLLGNVVDLLNGDREMLVDGMKTLGRIAGDAFVIGMNEALEAFVDKGNFFGRFVASKFGGNADVARGNLDANLEALAAIARAAQARAAARGSRGGGALGGGGAAGALAALTGGAGGSIPTLDGLTVVVSGGANFAGTDAWREFHRNRFRDPSGISRFNLTPSTREPDLKLLREGSKEFGRAAEVTVASFGAMAQAAIQGGQVTAQSVTGMISNIVQAATGGGILGSVLGAGLGIVGALFSRGGNRPLPVQVADYNSTALDKLKGVSGPAKITTIIEVAGVETERVERELLDRQDRDEVVRYGTRGYALGG